MQKKLTKLQAFNAISKLFQIYYKQTSSDDYGTLLGAMSFIYTYRTADPAMLEIWTEALNKTFSFKRLRSYNYLSSLQVLKALPFFLEEFFGKNSFDDINFIIKEIELILNKKVRNSIFWKNWSQCVDEVLSVKDSRDYLKLKKH